MAGLRINFASGLYDRFLALYTKEVVPEGIDLDFTVIDNPREIFDRMAGGLAFDACEMSGTEYISRLAAGECPFVSGAASRSGGSSVGDAPSVAVHTTSPRSISRASVASSDSHRSSSHVERK